MIWPAEVRKRTRRKMCERQKLPPGLPEASRSPSDLERSLGIRSTHSVGLFNAGPPDAKSVINSAKNASNNVFEHYPVGAGYFLLLVSTVCLISNSGLLVCFIDSFCRQNFSLSSLNLSKSLPQKIFRSN